MLQETVLEKELVGKLSDKVRRVTALADLFGIMAVMLDYKTLAQVCAGLNEGTLIDDVRTVFDELDLVDSRIEGISASLEALRADISSGRLSFAGLRPEYTRLFNHPDKPALPYYEGAFINRRSSEQGRDEPDHDLLFINQAACDADRQYKRAGVRRSLDENIPGDCMTTELAFMQYLLGLRVQAALGCGGHTEREIDSWLHEFVYLHLRVWMSDFFERLSKVSGQRYFQTVGSLGMVLADFLEARCPSAFRR